MKHRFLLIAFLTVSLPILIHSEEILVLNDGSKIIIKDNKTWEYITVEEQNNTIITLIKPDKNKTILNSQNNKYSVYYDSKIWETTTGINQNAEFQFVNKEKTGYAFIIYEGLNIPMNQYMEFLSNFTKKSGANIIEEKIEICLINNKEGRIRNMQIELQGLRFKMLTLAYTGEEGSIQFTAYTLDSEFEKLRPIFIQMLSGLVIK